MYRKITRTHFSMDKYEMPTLIIRLEWKYFQESKALAYPGKVENIPVKECITQPLGDFS
jgi:hypothetical protein